MAPTASPSIRMIRLSPWRTSGQIALHDDRLAIELGEHLQQRVQILVAGCDVEDAGPAIAEQRLDDDVLVLVAEGADLLRGPR